MSNASTRSSHTRAERTRVMILAAIITTIGLAAPNAEAWHVLGAEHAPPAVASSNEPLRLEVAVTTSCAIAYCGWIRVIVRYTDKLGEPREATAEMPYQPFVVLAPTVPGPDIAAPAFSYSVEVWQQNCLGDCHEEAVYLPRVGTSYSVRVV